MQRLASALCVTRKNRDYSTALPVPEIALAHARCGASVRTGVTSSTGTRFVSGDRLYSAASPQNHTPPQRSKLSKVLGALDTSNHMSMRAAIDRILRQPTLVGIDAPNLDETAHIEPMQADVTVEQPVGAHTDSDGINYEDSEIMPTCGSDSPKSHFRNLEHQSFGILGTDLESGRTLGVTSGDTLGDSEYTQVHSLTAANQFCPGSHELEKHNTFVYPLPRSSPFPSSSESSNDSILDFDTSPPALFGRSDGFSEGNDASSSHSILRRMRCQPSQGTSTRKASVGDVSSTISLIADPSGDDLEAGWSHTTCCNDIDSVTGDNDSGDGSLSDHGRGSTRIFKAGREVTADNLPSSIVFDLLSDPDPWETIGKILEFGPREPSTAQYLNIDFIKDREGVGYVSPERSNACNANHFDGPTSSRTSLVAPGANPLVLDTVDNVAVNVPESHNTTRLVFDIPSALPSEDDLYSHVRVLPMAPLASAAIHCAQDDARRSSFPPSIIVGTSAAEVDADMTFDGPCLFGDSDLEDDW